MKTSLRMNKSCPRMRFQILGQKVIYNLSTVNSSCPQNFLLPNTTGWYKQPKLRCLRSSHIEMKSFKGTHTQWSNHFLFVTRLRSGERKKNLTDLLFRTGPLSWLPVQGNYLLHFGPGWRGMWLKAESTRRPPFCKDHRRYNKRRTELLRCKEGWTSQKEQRQWRVDCFLWSLPEFLWLRNQGLKSQDKKLTFDKISAYWF